MSKKSGSSVGGKSRVGKGQNQVPPRKPPTNTTPKTTPATPKK